MENTRLKEIETRLSAIKAELDNEGADFTVLNTEADSLIQERKDILAGIETRKNLLNKIANSKALETVERKDNTMSNFGETRKITLTAEQQRSILTSTTGVTKPVGVSDIHDNLNVASSLAEMVDVQDCTGMGSNTITYVDTDASGSDRTEGNATNASEPTFGSITVTPSIEGVTGYISNEVKKQSPLQYESKVKASYDKALKKKMNSVVVDAIYNDSSIAKRVTDITIIDNKTLRKIALNYGGDDSIEGNAVLFLTKADLIAFGDVRGTNEKKAVYEITPSSVNPNVGIIQDGGLSVAYCLCSQATSFTGTSASTTDDTCTMFYGNPKCFELDLFGDAEVLADESYKFAERLITVRGDVTCGGAVTVKDGFIVVTIPKTVNN